MSEAATGCLLLPPWSAGALSSGSCILSSWCKPSHPVAGERDKQRVGHGRVEVGGRWAWVEGSGCSGLAPQFELSLDWGAREEPWASEERLLSRVGHPESQVRVHLPRDGGQWGAVGQGSVSLNPPAACPMPNHAGCLWPPPSCCFSALRSLKRLGNSMGRCREHWTGSPDFPGLAPTPVGSGSLI